jgi:hypothetical protein|tara:strand:- start:22445 stop:22696 length:252 start_codon:yes stop_codon:yes gene_type:complete
VKASNIALSLDGSIVIDDMEHPMGSTMWQIDGIPFTPIEASISTCQCREPTIVLLCKEESIVEICRRCNEIRLYKEKGVEINE